jgi:hypothetical protein
MLVSVSNIVRKAKSGSLRAAGDRSAEMHRLEIRRFGRGSGLDEGVLVRDAMISEGLVNDLIWERNDRCCEVSPPLVARLGRTCFRVRTGWKLSV